MMTGEDMDQVLYKENFEEVALKTKRSPINSKLKESLKDNSVFLFFTSEDKGPNWAKSLMSLKN